MSTSIANVVVLVTYLVAVLGSALWVARRRRRQVAAANEAHAGEEYFLASRSLSGWQLGLSLLATTMSSVTFLSYPGTSFKTNWLLLNKDFALPVICALAAQWVVPFYRRHVRLSVFEILEDRFNLTCRLYGALCYCALQLMRTCSVLYLSAFPMASLTGASHALVTILLGALIALYTVLGGFAAVVFTDVVQSLTLLGGGILMLAHAVSDAGGLSTVIEQASAAGKLRIDVDAADAGRTPQLLWLFGLSLYVCNMCVYQDSAQRYCAARSLREARLAVLLQATLAIPIWASFLLLGSALYVLSHSPVGAALFDSAAAAGGGGGGGSIDADDVTSQFALSVLPAGAGGFVLAGALAAAMSSLDSSINSVAMIVTTDFVGRWYLQGAPLTEARFLTFGRRTSICVAALTVLGALALRSVPKEGMNGAED